MGNVFPEGDWIRADLPNDGDPRTLLDRPVATGRLVLPKRLELAFDGSHLVYLNDMQVLGSPEPGMLDAFVKLADAAPARYLAFARRWGTLGCGFKFGRSLIVQGPGVLVLPDNPLEREGHEAVIGEDLARWREVVSQFRALINIVARLHMGQLGRPQDWQVVNEGWERKILVRAGGDADREKNELREEWEYMVRVGVDLDWERGLLALRVNQYLDSSLARPRVDWLPERQPGITLGGPGAMGVLAVQLAYVVTRTEAPALCSACGAAYVPARRPAPGRRRYCEACREKGVSHRHATAAWRARKRGSGASRPDAN